jgi:hypothetical protein
MSKLKDMSGVEALAVFLGAVTKYSIIMLYVFVSCFIFLFKKLNKKAGNDV